MTAARHLASMRAVDVVGYSRLTGRDWVTSMLLHSGSLAAWSVTRVNTGQGKAWHEA